VPRSAKRQHATRVWFHKYRATRFCKYCGEHDPACLDFHHHNPHLYKKASITRLVSKGVSIERLKAELAHCSVLCANCHRKLHAERREGGEAARPFPFTDCVRPNALDGKIPRS